MFPTPRLPPTTMAPEFRMDWRIEFCMASELRIWNGDCAENGRTSGRCIIGACMYSLDGDCDVDAPPDNLVPVREGIPLLFPKFELPPPMWSVWPWEDGLHSNGTRYVKLSPPNSPRTRYDRTSQICIARYDIVQSTRNLSPTSLSAHSPVPPTSSIPTRRRITMLLTT